MWEEAWKQNKMAYVHTAYKYTYAGHFGQDAQDSGEGGEADRSWVVSDGVRIVGGGGVRVPGLWGLSVGDG